MTSCASARRNFDEATAERFDWHWTQATVRGDTGVIAIALTIHLQTDGRPVEVPLRWIVGAVRHDGTGRWLHRHASSAASSQDEGTAYPTE
ncbi:MAG: nuclear transport factor 2 family protein [bacterium]|nr:nuclear transport factor 2 family protein [bacterium]MCP4959022.1 nuclear transport factor 2 family protein [Actinomycetes bacterium]